MPFGRLRPSFFFLGHWLFCRCSSAADLGIDRKERADKLLEMAKPGNLSLGLFLRGGSGKRLGYGLTMHFVSQARVRAMRRIAGLVTPAVGLAASAAGSGDGTTAQIAQTGDLLDEIGSSRLQILKRIGHEVGLRILAYLIRTD
jgi:hypothetical protein